jgi:hypothetical protein
MPVTDDQVAALRVLLSTTSVGAVLTTRCMC